MTGDPLFDLLLSIPRTESETLAKEAARWDDLRMWGDKAKTSLVGTHGIEGWKPFLKSPGKHIVKGFWEHTPTWMKPLMAYGAYETMKRPGGLFERAGRAAGFVLPFGIMPLKHGPGFLGSTALQEGLSGGMLVRDGLLPRIGKGIDKVLGTGPKKKKQVVQQPQPPQPQQQQYGQIPNVGKTASADPRALLELAKKLR